MGRPSVADRVSRQGIVRASRRTACGGMPAAQEGLAHVAPVAKARFPGHDFQRMPTAFDHQAGGFEPQPFYGLGGRLAGLGREDAAELARTQLGRLGQFLDAERLRQVAPRMFQRQLDAVGLAPA